MTQVLNQQAVANDLAWDFVVRICQKHLLRLKKSGANDGQITSELKSLVGVCCNKSRFLLDLYSNPHPLNTGTLSRSELEFLVSEEHKFSEREQFVLLGVFASAHWAEIEPRLMLCCERMNGNPQELSNCVALFIRMMHLTALRYGLSDLGPQISLDFRNHHPSRFEWRTVGHS